MPSSPRRARPWGRFGVVVAVPVICGVAGPAPERSADAAARAAEAADGSAAPALPERAEPALPLAAATAPVAPEGADAEPAEIADACPATPMSPVELAEALRAGHLLRFGFAPNDDRWACAWAQCAFEQARGDAIYANNIGHVTARSPGGKVCRRVLRDRVAKNPDRWELRDVWFRTFDTPAEGAAAYWSLLVDGYYSVLLRCDRADPRGAASRLAELGYFTGPEAPYVDGMAHLFVHARGVIIPKLQAAARPPDPDAAAGAGARARRTTSGGAP